VTIIENQHIKDAGEKFAMGIVAILDRQAAYRKICGAGDSSP